MGDQAIGPSPWFCSRSVLTGRWLLASVLVASSSAVQAADGTDGPTDKAQTPKSCAVEKVTADTSDPPNAVRYLILGFRPMAETGQEVRLGIRALNEVKTRLHDELADIVNVGGSQEEREELTKRFVVYTDPCVPEDDKTAREIGSARGVDLVIWGKSTGPLVSGAPQFIFDNHSVQRLDVEKGGSASVGGNMSSRGAIPSGSEIEKLGSLGEGAVRICAAVTSKDLPALRTHNEEPTPISPTAKDLTLLKIVGNEAYSYIAMVAGFRFYQAGEYGHALRLFRLVPDPGRSETPGWANLAWAMGDTEMRVGDPAEAIKLFESGSRAVTSNELLWWKHRVSLVNANIRAGRSVEAGQLAKKLVQQARAAGLDDETRSFALNDLAISLQDLGRKDAALEAILEAVRIRRHLVEQNPEESKLALALSLETLAASLGAANKKQEALGAARESVQILRLLSAEKPEEYEEELAMALDAFVSCLKALDMEREATEAAEEASDIRERQKSATEEGP